MALIVTLPACLVQKRVSLDQVQEEFEVAAQPNGNRWDQPSKILGKGYGDA
jgi:hypothetical protein